MSISQPVEHRPPFTAQDVEHVVTFVGTFGIYTPQHYPESEPGINAMAYAYHKNPELPLFGRVGLHEDIDLSALALTRIEAHEYVVNYINREAPFTTKQFLQITAGEPWWDGPRAWVVHDLATFVQYARYSCAVRNTELIMGWQPKRAGRPRTDPDSEQGVAMSQRKAQEAEFKIRFAEWVEACRERKEMLKAAHAEWSRLHAEAETARLRLRAMEAEGAPARPVRHN